MRPAFIALQTFPPGRMPVELPRVVTILSCPHVPLEEFLDRDLHDLAQVVARDEHSA